MRSGLRSNRDFQLLWTSQLLSYLGSLASFVVLPLLMFTLTGSATQAGLVAFCVSAGTMAASLPGGVLADRMNRRALMLACDAARAVAMAILAAAVLLAEEASTPVILLAAAVDGALSSLFASAEIAALQRIVTRGQLPSALAMNQGRAAAAALLGAPLGGLLFSLSHGLPLVVNALSYAVSFLCVLCIRTPLAVAHHEAPRFRRDDLLAGMRFLWSHPFLRFTTIGDVTLNFAFSGILLAVIAASARTGSPGLSTGAIIGLAGAGTLIGAVVAPRLQPVMFPRRTVLAVCWTTTALVPLMAVNQSAMVLGAILAVCAVMGPIEYVVICGTRILLTPDTLQGRVQSASGLIGMSATPLGPLVAGLLVDGIGISGTFLCFAGVVGMLACASMVSRGLRTKLPLRPRLVGTDLRRATQQAR
jgi:MFS family permease